MQRAARFQPPAELADGSYSFQVAASSAARRSTARAALHGRHARRPPAPQIHQPRGGQRAHVDASRSAAPAEAFTTITIKVRTARSGAASSNETGWWDATAEEPGGGRPTSSASRRPTRRATSRETQDCGRSRVDTPPVATITRPRRLTNNGTRVRVHRQRGRRDVPVPGLHPRNAARATSSTARRRTRCATWSTARTSSRSARSTRRRGRRAGSYTFTVDTVAPNPPTITEPDERHRDRATCRSRCAARPSTSRPSTSTTARSSARPMIVNEGTGGWYFDDRRARPGRPRVHRDRRRTTPATSSQPSAPVTVYVHPNGPTAPIAGPALTRDDTPTFTVSPTSRTCSSSARSTARLPAVRVAGDARAAHRRQVHAHRAPDRRRQVSGAPVSAPVHRRPHAAAGAAGVRRTVRATPRRSRSAPARPA